MISLMKAVMARSRLTWKANKSGKVEDKTTSKKQELRS